MLRNLNDIREDKSFDLLTEAILQRDQPRTADLFHKMIVRDGRSIGEALSVVAAAEAPFVNVPCHINLQRRQHRADQQRPHVVGPAGLDLSDAVPAREVSAAAAVAERLVHRRRARHLEPAAGQISRPLRDDEGHPCTAARLRAGSLAGGGRTDPRERNARRAAACLHGRDDDRQFEARARAIPRPRRGRGKPPGIARDDRVSRPDRPAGHGDRTQGAQHRAQGDPRPGGHRPRQLHRLGELARRLLHGRARHGGRPALLFAVRPCQCSHQRRVPGRRRQEPEKHQPDAVIAARGRGDSSTC